MILYLFLLVVILTGCYLYFSKNAINSALRNYMNKKEFPSIKKVVVFVEGCDLTDINKTVHSILLQSIRVSEIATNKDGKTCKPSPQCDAVLNKYGDPFKKGIVKSTFEREMDAETVVVFIKNGYVFKDEDELENLLKRWKNAKSIVETEHIKIMNSNQCDDFQKN